MRRHPRRDRSPLVLPITVRPRAATPRPRRTSGRPPRGSPGPPVGSGRKRDRGRKPGASPRVGGSSSPGARPRTSDPHAWLPQRGAAPAGTAALRSFRSYAPPTEEPGARVTTDPPRGSPHAAAAAIPRTAAGESAPGESGPVPGDADRAPTGTGAAAAVAVAAAVTAMSSGAGRTDPSPAAMAREPRRGGRRAGAPGAVPTQPPTGGAPPEGEGVSGFGKGAGLEPGPRRSGERWQA